MQPACIGADMFRHVGREGDHVMPCLLLDLADALDRKSATLADGLCRFLRHDSSVGQHLARGSLHIEPAAKARFV